MTTRQQFSTQGGDFLVHPVHTRMSDSSLALSVKVTTGYGNDSGAGKTLEIVHRLISPDGVAWESGPVVFPYSVVAPPMPGVLAHAVDVVYHLSPSIDPPGKFRGISVPVL